MLLIHWEVVGAGGRGVVSQWLVNQDFSKPGMTGRYSHTWRVWLCWMKTQTQKGWAGSLLGHTPQRQANASCITNKETRLKMNKDKGKGQCKEVPWVLASKEGRAWVSCLPSCFAPDPTRKIQPPPGATLLPGHAMYIGHAASTLKHSGCPLHALGASVSPPTQG